MDMPLLGLGTWPLAGDQARRTVRLALELGYRHVDTAQMYGNEAEVGAGLREAGVPRDEVFVTTKIHQDRFTEGTALESARASVEAIGLGPVDLILCHWPPRGVAPAQVAEELAAMRDEGLTRHIGVSNFNVSQMREAAAAAPILTNQVEFHPLLDQSRLLAAAREIGVTLTAYRPILRGEALRLPAVRAIAAETGRNPAAVVLRWIIQQGVHAICMSTSRERLAGNQEALDFSLSEDQMARITALTSANRRSCDYPDWQPDWEG